MEQKQQFLKTVTSLLSEGVAGSSGSRKLWDLGKLRVVGFENSTENISWTCGKVLGNFQEYRDIPASR